MRFGLGFVGGRARRETLKIWRHSFLNFNFHFRIRWTIFRHISFGGLNLRLCFSSLISSSATATKGVCLLHSILKFVLNTWQNQGERRMQTKSGAQTHTICRTSTFGTLDFSILPGGARLISLQQIFLPSYDLCACPFSPDRTKLGRILIFSSPIHEPILFHLLSLPSFSLSLPNRSRTAPVESATPNLVPASPRPARPPLDPRPSYTAFPQTPHLPPS